VPALSGQVITTITRADGTPAVCVTWFFNPAAALNAADWTDPLGVLHLAGTVLLNTLRNNTQSWTDPSGTVWPAGAGALIGVNLLDTDVRMIINGSDGSVIRRVLLAAGTGRAVTRTQLANAAPPDGPYVFSQDLNGITFDLSGAQ
jgi:hypothetical protein